MAKSLYWQDFEAFFNKCEYILSKSEINAEEVFYTIIIILVIVSLLPCNFKQKIGLH